VKTVPGDDDDEVSDSDGSNKANTGFVNYRPTPPPVFIVWSHDDVDIRWELTHDPNGTAHRLRSFDAWKHDSSNIGVTDGRRDAETRLAIGRQTYQSTQIRKWRSI
jgi:hypothetical protein